MQSIKQTCATFLIVAFLAPGLFLGIAPPKQAEAAGEGLIGDIIGAGVSYALCEYGDDIGDFLDDMLGGALGSIFGTDQSEDPDSTESLEYSVPVSESNKQIKQDTGKTRSGVESDLYKECVLDPVAWVIKSLLINEVEDDILEWVNTGFEDGPIFVRDPVDFAKSLARDSFDVYLDDSEVDDYVCPQFIDDDIMQRFEDLSTQSAYGNSGSARCTVDTNDYYTMVTNGSVEGVGIIEAMSLVQEGNNPYSSFFNLQADAAKRTGEVVAREMTILEYGDGYHSPRCEQNDKEGVCTPGQLVSKQIDDWLGGALGQLENADEVSEIISDLIAKLVSSIFSNEDDGLLGDYDLEGDDADPLSGDGYTNPLDPGGDGGDGSWFTGTTCYATEYETVTAADVVSWVRGRGQSPVSPSPATYPERPGLSISYAGNNVNHQYPYQAHWPLINDVTGDPATKCAQPNPGDTAVWVLTKRADGWHALWWDYAPQCEPHRMVKSMTAPPGFEDCYFGHMLSAFPDKILERSNIVIHQNGRP